MAYAYLNLNPKKRNVSDCTVRAFALAHNISWYDSFDILTDYAREACIVLDDTSFIDEFLSNKYDYICYKCFGEKVTVGSLCNQYPIGIYLITMSGHITCMIDGVIYDTWDCTEKYAWRVWEVAG